MNKICRFIDSGIFNEVEGGNVLKGFYAKIMLFFAEKLYQTHIIVSAWLLVCTVWLISCPGGIFKDYNFNTAITLFIIKDCCWMDAVSEFVLGVGLVWGVVIGVSWRPYCYRRACCQAKLLWININLPWQHSCCFTLLQISKVLR